MTLFRPQPHERDLAQMIFPELLPGEHTEEELRRLAEAGFGGFCVYEGTVEEVFRAVAFLQGAAPEPLLMCGDYEWGVGRHVRGGTLFPPMMAVGATGSEEWAYRKGRITALESKALGVDWVLAPVVDLATRPDNPIVNTRASSADVGLTTRLSRAFLRGLHDGGCQGCLKHFPGHGETGTDSHLELPSLGRGEEELWERELVPFRELAGECEAVMLGHLLVPGLDELPVSLSKKAVEGLLRGRMGFQGLVATDALMMGAIAKHFPLQEAALLAVQAGVDVLLVPEDPFALHTALVEAYEAGRIEPERLRKTAAKIRASKASLSRPDPAGLDKVGCAEHIGEAEALAREALAWLKAPRGAWLKPGESFAYLELGAQDEGAARPFLEELRGASVSWRPYEEGWRGKTLAAVFSSPMAFSGAINLSPEEEARLKAAPAGQTAVVSFGSPFVFPEPGRLAAALCAFSDLRSAQKGAAEVLLGRYEPRGKIPVDPYAAWKKASSRG